MWILYDNDGNFIIQSQEGHNIEEIKNLLNRKEKEIEQLKTRLAKHYQ